MHWWLAAALLLSGNAWGAPEIIDFEEHWDTDGVIGAPYVMRSRLVAARDLTVARPIADAKVELVLRKGEVEHRTHAITGADGVAWLVMPTDDFTAGTWRRHISYEHATGGGGSAGGAVEFTPAAITRLATDRPVYEPDQTLRWRVTSLHRVTGKPNPGEAKVIIKDPRGTQMWRGTVALDDRGMAAGALPLGRDARRGRWHISANVGGDVITESFEFKRVELAPFAVQATRIGASNRYEIRATYPYGEPVQGTMAVKVAPLEGEPRPLKDGVGHIRVMPRLRQSTTAEITVKDGAERIGRTLVTVPPSNSRRSRGAVIAEPLAAGRRGHITVITTDADGRLKGGTVEVQIAGGPLRSFKTDGVVRVPVRPAKDESHLSVEVNFEGVGRMDQLRVRAANAPTLAVAQNVVRRGETIRLRGAWPEAYGELVATVFHSGAPIGQVPLTRRRRGEVRADFPAPAVPGLVQIRVHDAGWIPSAEDDKQLHVAAVDVYVRPLALSVALTPDATRLKPGAVTAFTAMVRDARGAAVMGAGIAASVVDTRLLALGTLPPPLMESLRAMDVNGARAAGTAFVDLLDRTDSPAIRARAALLRSLPESVETPQASIPAAERWQEERERLTGHRYAIIEAAAAWPKRLARWTRAKGWHYVAPVHRLLPEAERRDAWKRPVSWAYLDALEVAYPFPEHADEILYARADLLREAVFDDPMTVAHARKGLSLVGKVPAHLLRDPWGHRVRFAHGKDGWTLIAAGPDGRFKTKDDRRVAHIFSLRGYGRGAGGLGMRRASRPRVVAGRPAVLGAGVRHGTPTGPAVRKNFEGTVLWAVGARTNRDGEVRFEVPLSDRITGWRVEVEAVGADGAVGHATAEIETFLPRFADVQLPPALAEGDRYRAFAYVTNHGPAGHLTLEAAAEGSVALAEPVRLDMTLAKGEARRVPIPLIAGAAGAGIVRLSLATDDAVSDRIERRLQVEPQGSMVERVYSARVSGEAALEWTVPTGAQATRATLRVFRGASDIALDGIDAMLRAPYGCFEQTSSSTFPNLLVLDLLRDAKGAEATRAKARKFIALGYQRLVGYEVDGGGFSWFGEAPANKVLTAYGVLEFADMAKVYPVDPALIARTSAWLLDQQQDDGAWTPDAKWLHDWKAVQRGALATTAWIAWTLAEAGTTDPRLDKAIAWLEARQAKLEPFELGLLAGAQTARGRPATAVGALADASKSGRIAAGRSLFSRLPKTADVQATALATQAFLRGGDARRAEAAFDWIWKQRTAAGWGNTQATVLALRAALGQRTAPLPAGAAVALTLDDTPIEPLGLDGDAVPTRALASAPGKHVVRLAAPGKTRADLRVSWRSATPPTTPEAHGLAITVERPAGAVQLGHAARFAVRIANPGTTAIAMPTIEVPTPPGFRVDETRFRPQGVARAEDQGDRVIFYLERLAPGEERVIAWHLQALAEADVLHRPATAFAYYDPDIRGRSAAARVRIEAPKRVALAPAGPRLTAESVGLAPPARRSRGSADQPAGRTRSDRR